VVSFVENQKDSCSFYSEADWDRVNLIYIELLKEANQYNDKLSINEKRQIAQATTTYILLQRHRKKENRIKKNLTANSHTNILHI